MSRSGFTAQTGFLIASIFALFGSAAFHWAVQAALTSNTIMAATMTAVFVLAPPTFVGFMFPRSPAGMLLMKIQMPTWGGVVLVASACFIVGYDFVLTLNWWLLPEQGVVAEAGYASMQAALAMFGFHFLPGLLLAPAATPEVVHAMHQAHLVKRYELQTQAELALLRRASIDAQTLAARGLADLSPQERRFLGSVFKSLVNGIDQTLRDMTTSVKAVAGVAVPYRGLSDNAAVQHSLKQVEQALLPGESSTDARRSGPSPRTQPEATSTRPAQPSADRPTDRDRQGEGSKRPEGGGQPQRRPESGGGQPQRRPEGSGQPQRRPESGGGQPQRRPESGGGQPAQVRGPANGDDQARSRPAQSPASGPEQGDQLSLEDL